MEQPILLTVIFGYLAFIILWGLYQGRRVKSSTDFSIAGRSLPGWAAALSERATGESSWALLGLPGFAYASGLTSIWTALGCMAGIITAWIVIARRLRDEADDCKACTFIDYIAKRHGTVGPAIRLTGSLIVVFFFFFYVGAQFLGGGKTLDTLFHIDPRIGIALTAAVIIPYTIYGGFRSVVYTDVIQSLVMITTLVVGPIAGMIAISGNPELFANTIPQALSRAGEKYTSLTGALSGFSAGVAILGGLSWFFGYLGGQPQLSMRFMAIRDSRQVKLARNIGILWTLLAYAGALSIGWIGIALFGPSGTSTGLKDAEFVMPLVMLEIFPAPVAALLITGAIAAMISTADSILIVSSTELSNNFFKAGGKKKDSSNLVRSRLITAALALIALAAAYLTPTTLIFTLVGYVWAGIGSTFSVVILYTLFWKRYHGRAALLTMIVGMTFTIFWISSGLDEKVSARVMTFAAAGLTGFLATLLLPAGKRAK